MLDMSESIDVYVCRPASGINHALDGVFLQFELADKRTMEGIGKPFSVAMTTLDAMWLLKHLQYMQNRFDLPVPSEPIEDATPGKPN